MFKVLLAWRYLKTRFIALASIVSVTLGVMTLIVVNSVMTGFSEQMKSKLHGVLSDVEVAAAGMGEIPFPERDEKEIREVLGDDLVAITKVVRVPAMINFMVNGRPRYQQIFLFGIDDETFSTVSDFRPYLLNTKHQTESPFKLMEDGYSSDLPDSGWPYRRLVAQNRKRTIALQQGYNLQSQQALQNSLVPSNLDRNSSDDQHSSSSKQEGTFRPIPTDAPDLEKLIVDNKIPGDDGSDPNDFTDPTAKYREPDQFVELDAETEQRVGIVLGIGIGKIRAHDPETGKSKDHFFLRPGDDVELTVPSAGTQPQPILENCTVTDFYQSNMSQYDGMFAFMPLSHLQKIRGMIDPRTGVATVNSLQMKLAPTANLDEVRTKLRKRFSSRFFPYIVQTWEDSQGMILNAIDMEITVMNILLFLIIAVAGFGILATFYMIVVEKTKDIGVLKSLGASSKGIASIFLSYGLSLGIVGSGAGTILGLLFVYFINDIADFLSYLAGRKIVDPSVYLFNEIPTLIQPSMVLGVAAGAMAVAILASVLPAIRAATMHPVDSLRYE